MADETRRFCFRAKSHGPPADGLTQCHDCLAKENARRRKRIASGMCSKSEVHGPSSPGRTLCFACLTSKRRARSKLAESGTCINGASHGPRLPGKKTCAACSYNRQQRVVAAKAPFKPVVSVARFLGEGGDAVEVDAADSGDEPCM